MNERGKNKTAAKVGMNKVEEAHPKAETDEVKPKKVKSKKGRSEA